MLILCFLLGLCVLAYPFFTSWYNARVRSEIRYNYAEQVSSGEMQEQIIEIERAAVEYNESLYTGEISPLNPDENGYWGQLQFEESEMMCYIRIPAISVELPVYHGIGYEELLKGAGHMPQSSLPIGGENTHCVISAHSGMASSPMFTDIGLLKEGDLVYIDILGKTLVYEVYGENETVLPTDIDSIQIQPGEDLLTLVTCTPINVNSHRLLVHCRRVEEETVSASDASKEAPATEAEQQIQTTISAEHSSGDSQQTEGQTQSLYLQAYKQNLLFGVLLGAGIALLLSSLAVFFVRRKNRKQDNDQ